jgi:hypothetical protein
VEVPVVPPSLNASAPVEVTEDLEVPVVPPSLNASAPVEVTEDLEVPVVPPSLNASAPVEVTEDLEVPVVAPSLNASAPVEVTEDVEAAAEAPELDTGLAQIVYDDVDGSYAQGKRKGFIPSVLRAFTVFPIKGHENDNDTTPEEITHEDITEEVSYFYVHVSLLSEVIFLFYILQVYL